MDDAAAATAARPPRPRRWRRRIARAVLGLVGLVVVLAVAGAACEAVGRARDARRWPAPGRLVAVDGRRLHLHCTGAGRPTVVLESGLGNPALGWALVQPDAARLTRVCAYDRGGYGHSDPPARHPRTAAQLAAELHALLERAGEPGPYVLVGHSFGGLIGRVFAARFPADTAGLVMVDASHEDAHTRLPRQRPAAHLSRMIRLGRQLGRFGVLRLRPDLAGWDQSWDGFRRLPAATRRELTALALRPGTLEAAAAEADAFEASGAQARAAGSLGDRPLVVLVAARRHPDLSHLPATARDPYYRVWVEELQPALARLSTRGTLRVLPDSGHSIHLERPAAVVEAITDVVGQVRDGAPPPAPAAPHAR